MRWGIRTSLVVGLAGLLLAAGGIAAAVVVQLVGGEAEARVLDAQRARAVAEARALEARCALPDACAAALEAFGAVRTGLSDRQGPQRAVYGPNGQTLVGPLVSNSAPDALALDALQGAALAWRRIERPPEHTRGRGVDHRVAAPVRLGDGRRAAAVFTFPLDDLHGAVAERQRLVLAYLAFDFVAVLLFGIYVSGRVLVRPVRALTAAVERVEAAPDAEALPPAGGPRELARLSAAFAAMLERLAARQRALEESLAQLEATRDELVRSEKLATVGRLAAGVAHEVGNPLASVMGFVEFLRDPRGCPPAQQADLLARMDRELGRIQGTLRQLLDFSRPAPSRIEAVDVAAVCADAIALVGYQKAAATVEVAGEASALADRERLRQVLVNLLMNAAQAGAAAVRIELASSADSERVTIAVQDDGPGVDPALVDGLFEPFATTRPAGQGTGLGLAISRRLVEEMGGTLRFVPADTGARFVLELRRADREAARQTDGIGRA